MVLNETDEQVDWYQELLRQKRNFVLHASVAILSFLVFGLVPPVVYGFSFYQSDNRNLKLAVAAVAALLCITVLAIVKSYTQKPSKWSIYITTILPFYRDRGLRHFLLGRLPSQETHWETRLVWVKCSYHSAHEFWETCVGILLISWVLNMKLDSVIDVAGFHSLSLAVKLFFYLCYVFLKL